MTLWSCFYSQGLVGRSQGIPKYPQTGNTGVNKGGFSKTQTLKVFEGIRAGAKRAPARTGHPCNSRWGFLMKNSTFTQQRHFSSFSSVVCPSIPMVCPSFPMVCPSIPVVCPSPQCVHPSPSLCVHPSPWINS